MRGPKDIITEDFYIESEDFAEADLHGDHAIACFRPSQRPAPWGKNKYCKDCGRAARKAGYCDRCYGRRRYAKKQGLEEVDE